MSSNDFKEDIRSVNVRSTQIKKSLLMSHEMVHTFQTLLENNIGSEVLVINTNTGMEVYYYANIDYFEVIKKAVSSYLASHVDRAKLRFRNNHCKEEVHKSFCEAFFTFAKYPQLFLAYAKKFKHIRQKNKDSQYILPVLNSFFENSLRILAETGRIPHYQKIRDYKPSDTTAELDDSVIKELISEILLKMRSN